MYSDKTEKNITKCSRALGGVQDVAANFDATSGVIVRNWGHTAASSQGDEMSMINDLRRLRPFQYVAGRSHRSFPNMASSVLQNPDADLGRSGLGLTANNTSLQQNWETLQGQHQ